MLETETLKDCIAVKDSKYHTLFIDSKGKVWLFWKLSEYQRQRLGTKVNWFNCWRKGDFCDLHLKRPHLTCFTCKLRAVITLKNPFLQPIQIHQIWSYPNKNSIHRFIFSKVLSLAEALS